MIPVDIVGSIFNVAKAIYDRVELVQSNKQRWKLLVEVIRQVVSSLDGLKDLSRQRNFSSSLQALYTCISDANTFMNKMISLSYMERLAKAGKHQEKIDAFRSGIIEQANLLKLGLNAQQLINHEQDRRAEVQDKEAFVRQKEESLANHQKNLAKQQSQYQAVIRKQMDDFIEKLEDFWENKSEKIASSKSYPQVSLFDINFDKKVLSTRNGDIYTAQWQTYPVRVKWVEGIITQEGKQQFIREVEVMSQLRHPGILNFYGACVEMGRMALVTEHLERSLLLELEILALPQRLQVVTKLLHGLIYLHQMGIVHGEVEPSNVGLTQDGQPKWLDLSWIRTDLSSIASLGVAHDASVWQAPEAWGRRDIVNRACDIYSFGWVMWTLYTGRLPFHNQSFEAVSPKILAGLREEIPPDCPASYARAITACWSDDPAQRPELSDIIELLNTNDAPTREAAILSDVNPLVARASQALPPRPPSPTGEELYSVGKAALERKDYPIALNEFEKSGQKGCAKAFNMLGLFSLKGQGGCPRSSSNAQSYFEQASSLGLCRAKINLGKMYENGEATGGVSVEQALAYYHDAIDYADDDEKVLCLKKINTIQQKFKR